MSAGQPPTAAEPPPVQPQHYQILCGLALGVIFLIMLEQGMLMVGLMAVFLGTAAIVLRVRLSPLLILLALVGGQLFMQYTFPVWRLREALQVEDVVLCAATLAYVAGHYRLLALWSHILPPDPRQRYHRAAHTIVPVRRLGKPAPQYRPAAQMSRGELAWFVAQLPLFALLAQGVWLLLGGRRELHELPPRWVQFLQVSWGLALVLFLAGQIFRVLRMLQMDRVTAQVLLQDVLWHETRGEQRRIGRWLAWFRARRRAK